MTNQATIYLKIKTTSKEVGAVYELVNKYIQEQSLPFSAFYCPDPRRIMLWGEEQALREFLNVREAYVRRDFYSPPTWQKMYVLPAGLDRYLEFAKIERCKKSLIKILKSNASI